jgi:Rrf2 family transcriptional regulator, iron-sulfur cluster assembly transcription factor
MSLSNTADYALRAVVVLGRSFGAGVLHADEIARATGTPRNYMAKVLNALAKAGVVTSARGPAGGFVLGSAPETITVAQVIELFDQPHPHTRCLLGNGACHPADPCAAHRTWDTIVHRQREPLLTTTISDLLRS